MYNFVSNNSFIATNLYHQCITIAGLYIIIIVRNDYLLFIYIHLLEVKKERKKGLGRAIPYVVTEAWFCKTIPIKDPKTKLSLLLIVRNPVVKFPNLE